MRTFILLLLIIPLAITYLVQMRTCFRSRRIEGLFRDQLQALSYVEKTASFGWLLASLVYVAVAQTGLGTLFALLVVGGALATGVELLAKKLGVYPRVVTEI